MTQVVCFDRPMTRPTPPRRERPTRGGPRGRRATHSLEAVVEGAVALLDESNGAALTFRGLAARLGTGVGSIYWYVASRDELLARASDEVVGEVLRSTDAMDGDAYENLRELSIALYETMLAHPWVPNYLLRNATVQPNSLAMYERFGQQVQRLALTTRQRFDATSALLRFVLGAGAEIQADRFEAEPSAEDLHTYANQWRSLDPEQFPFVHEIADEFEVHKDVDQFMAGVDLILTGIAAQAGDQN